MHEMGGISTLRFLGLGEMSGVAVYGWEGKEGGDDKTLSFEGGHFPILWSATNTEPELLTTPPISQEVRSGIRDWRWRWGAEKKGEQRVSRRNIIIIITINTITRRVQISISVSVQSRASASSSLAARIYPSPTRTLPCRPADAIRGEPCAIDPAVS